MDWIAVVDGGVSKTFFCSEARRKQGCLNESHGWLNGGHGGGGGDHVRVEQRQGLLRHLCRTRRDSRLRRLRPRACRGDRWPKRGASTSRTIMSVSVEGERPTRSRSKTSSGK